MQHYGSRQRLLLRKDEDEMKIGYSYTLDTEPGMASVTIDREGIEDLLRATERRMDMAVQGKRYNIAVEEAHIWEELNELLQKVDKKKDLDTILTEE